MDIETCFKFKVKSSKIWTTISFCHEQKDGSVYESLTVYDGRVLSLLATANEIEMTSRNNVSPEKISFGTLLVQALEAQM